MRFTPRRFMALAALTSATAFAFPVASAGAAPLPGVPALPAAGAVPLPALPAVGPPLGGVGIGGNAIGRAGCVGTNRPSFGGNNGSTSASSCGAILSFSGPQIGQVAATIGPTVIGSQVLTPIQTTNGAITNAAMN